MTKRGRNVFWTAVVLIVGAIGVLGILHATTFDPNDVKAELEKKIEELNAIPAEEAIRKDLFAEELRDNVSYKEHAKALWLKVERAHRPLHDAAQLEKAAAKEVPPFLARSKNLSGIERADLQILIGEAKALLGNYGTTRYADALRKRLAELNAKLESLPKPVTTLDFMEMNRKATLAQAEGRYSDAMDLIDEFMKRPGTSEYVKKVEALQESLRTKAASSAAAILQRAQGLLDRGDKVAALQVLDRSQADFRRFKKETDAFDALRRKITTR